VEKSDVFGGSGPELNVYWPGAQSSGGGVQTKSTCTSASVYGGSLRWYVTVTRPCAVAVAVQVPTRNAWEMSLPPAPT